ncbi:MAG: MutS-related protein [Lachnospiraceae bacterium]
MEVLVMAGVAIVLVIAGILLISWDIRNRQKRIRINMRESYGSIPKEQERDYDCIPIYWNEIKDRFPEDEIIDDITWNDLEMEKIFERISNGNSFIGEQVLYARLHHLPRERGPLDEFEKKVRWLDANEEARVNFQYDLWNMGKQDVNYYAPMFIANLEDQKLANTWVYRLLQVSLILFIILAVISRGSVAFAAGINFIVNITLYAMNKQKYEVQLGSLSVIAGIIRFCTNLKKGTQFPSELISDQVKNSLNDLVPTARKAVLMNQKKQASRGGDPLGMIQDYIIGATLWDFVQYDKIIRELVRCRQAFEAVYTFAGEIDMAITVGSFRRSVPGWCVPEFAERKSLLMEECYHPLVNEPVKNSLTMNRNLILTGSNASGKSTFIKSAAINTIFASSIHTCLADRMQLPDAIVVTSMSMRDDVVGGESYFITEIKYLKRIVEKSGEGRIVICMIDEILRGTNTRERIAASEAVLRYLNRKNCLVMVATHDLELTKRFAETCDMYHFSEKLGQQDVSFDYKLKNGVSNTSNAIDLLEFVGFPGEVVTEARKLVKGN